MWSGNENGGNDAKEKLEILSASAVLPVGPRVLNSTMGPVSARAITRFTGLCRLAIRAGFLDAPRGLAADATDLALTLTARDHLPRRGSVLVSAIAAGGVALGAAAIAQLEKH